MITRMLTAAAVVAGLMAATVDAKPMRKRGVSSVEAAERATTRDLNAKQLASAGTTSAPAAMGSNPAPAEPAPMAPAEPVPPASDTTMPPPAGEMPPPSSETPPPPPQ